MTQRTIVDDLGRVLAGGAAALKKALSPPLKAGDTGPSVLSLQQSLNRVGAALIEDSIFGTRTKAAVAAFQRDHGVRPARGAGTVDEATWDALRLGGRATASAVPGQGSTESWAAMPAQRRADFRTLGYTAATWRSKTPPLAGLLPYALLSEKQRAAATRLGYTRESWRANRDTTAGTAAKGFAAEEAAAKRKAGARVLPAKYVGSLRAKAMIAAEFGADVDIQLAKVHLLTEAEMKKAYEGYYGAGSYTPINGFTVKPDIYLNNSSIWAGTTVHESLHVQEHGTWDAFAYQPTSAFGEGATTILTELVMTRHEQPVTHHPYAAEVALVRKMNTHAGLDKMRAAYFQGATGDYRTGVTGGLKPGTTWAQFRALVDAGALAAAQARLK
ncbi:peptidoglycan-binding domain-containing protein [Geodermatophilus ruber]|nr:peptidoglycan-binding protein [Geodermatophilus ruber]